jgi:transcription initiation factor TFIIIB Brf1 subunit/transcription initiation factor TFIIB
MICSRCGSTHWVWYVEPVAIVCEQCMTITTVLKRGDFHKDRAKMNAEDIRIARYWGIRL